MSDVHIEFREGECVFDYEAKAPYVSSVFCSKIAILSVRVCLFDCDLLLSLVCLATLVWCVRQNTQNTSHRRPKNTKMCFLSLEIMRFVCLLVWVSFFGLCFVLVCSFVICCGSIMEAKI